MHLKLNELLVEPQRQQPDDRHRGSRRAGPARRRRVLRPARRASQSSGARKKTIRSTTRDAASKTGPFPRSALRRCARRRRSLATGRVVERALQARAAVRQSAVRLSGPVITTAEVVEIADEGDAWMQVQASGGGRGRDSRPEDPPRCGAVVQQAHRLDQRAQRSSPDRTSSVDGAGRAWRSLVTMCWNYGKAAAAGTRARAWAMSLPASRCDSTRMPRRSGPVRPWRVQLGLSRTSSGSLRRINTRSTTRTRRHRAGDRTSARKRRAGDVVAQRRPPAEAR